VEQQSPGPPFSPTIALLTLAELVERQLEPLLITRGITQRKYGILGHIAASPGISYSELARRSGITVQSTHALIGSLMDAGLVASEPARPGTPASLVATPRGQQLLEELAEVVAGLDALTFDGGPLAVLREPLEAGMRAAMEGLRGDRATFS
jgi:DNA-binding MarR family transcriptional regulator